MAHFTEIIAQQDQLNLLNGLGYKGIVDTILLNEDKCFTKGGRINKSAVCRILKCKTVQLEEWLNKCKEHLSY